MVGLATPWPLLLASLSHILLFVFKINIKVSVQAESEGRKQKGPAPATMRVRKEKKWRPEAYLSSPSMDSRAATMVCV